MIERAHRQDAESGAGAGQYGGYRAEGAVSTGRDDRWVAEANRHAGQFAKTIAGFDVNVGWT
jgi:hypothetical protein